PGFGPAGAGGLRTGVDGLGVFASVLNAVLATA
ncbi:MAG: phosphoribosylformylglycinamidine synthase subunit PurQ, partial [Actinomyces graevenitzii]|nr:phosphoribosylformylglycinamidine synthase subunit PurQ [Actinomyces graevenitzii]